MDHQKLLCVYGSYWHERKWIGNWLNDNNRLSEAKPLTDGDFLFPLSSQGIQHQADVALIGACVAFEFFQNAVNRLEGIRNLVVQMLLGRLIGHLVKQKSPWNLVDPWGLDCQF